MNKTKIEWVRNPDGSQGYTWNPITGCLNHVNGMCKGGGFPCYAYRLAHGRLKERYKGNDKIAIPLTGMDLVETHKAYCDPFYPRFWPERVREEFGSYTAGAEPKGIFVCDMSDLFGVGVPEEWTRRVLSHIGMSWYKEHRFYLLTKQPQNLIKFSPFPDNCWVGVTATDNVMFHRARHRFESIKAGLLYVSFEPLLERIKIDWTVFLGGIKWVIIGAQTKPYKPPKWEWVSEIIDACVDAGIPYFLKNNLEAVVPKVFGGEGELNQEMPK